MLEVKPFSFRDRRFLELLDRGGLPDPDQDMEAADIISSVLAGGEQALRQQPRENAPGLRGELRVGEEDMTEARNRVPERFLTALSLARVNIRKFHEYQRRHGFIHDDGDGVRLARQVRPLSSVGICCGHSFSTLLAYTVTAQVAGVGRLIVAAATNHDGEVDPYVLATAKVLGVDEVYRLTGAHAVAAMAYGITPIPRVDKIVGPGSGLAPAAKRLVRGKVGVDSDLGLSELVVVADDGANAKFIAADLLSQAAHDDGRGVGTLLTTDRLLAEAVRIELDRLSESQPNTALLRASLAKRGALYVCQDLDVALTAANDLAPARLALMTRNDEACIAEVENAGLVLVGPWSTELCGDYFAGALPFLPVAGAARFAAGLGVDDFVREFTVVEYGADRLLKTGRHLAALAEGDGAIHLAALEERLELLRMTVE